MIAEHLVTLSLPVSGQFGQKTERLEVARLQSALKETVESRGLGKLDGDEWGHGIVTLFFYGPDADQILTAIEPVLRHEHRLAAAQAVKRYGTMGAKEVVITWDREGHRSETATPRQQLRRLRRARTGDVFELLTPRGLAYIQYSHKDDTYGEVVRVLEGLYNERPLPERLAALVAGPTVFHALLFLDDTLKQGFATLVARHPIPPHSADFPTFRDGLPNPRTRKVEDWVLWDGEHQWAVGSLTPEQRKLPLRRILTGESLGSRIARGWRPEDDPH